MTLLHQAAQKAVEALTRDIMNMRGGLEDDWSQTERGCYKLGQRDARHEAVALVNDAIAALESALQQQPEPVALTVDLTPWEKARYGAFHPDGRFEELPAEGWDHHPLAHTARWVGGRHDMELLRAALQHQEVPREPVATLRVTLEYDDGDGPLEIVCHGTELNMRRLDARLKFLHRLEKQSNDCAASPSTTRQQEVGND